jgi:hypothetical protein
MKKFKFLLKPAFFIFNLLFASWLVLGIEKIKPAHLGKYRTLFENVNDPSIEQKKKMLMKLCKEYRSGAIDSLHFSKAFDALVTDQADLASNGTSPDPR